MGNQDDSLLELLDFYMDIVEKQDEIICRMGKIIARQATNIKLLQNDREFSDEKLEEDMAITQEAMEQYKEARAELEP